jgi:hypothetical protein
MQSHTKDHVGNLLIRTQIQRLRMSGPLNGARGAPAASNPLCFGFEPGALVDPTIIVVPVLDIVVISRDG